MPIEDYSNWEWQEAKTVQQKKFLTSQKAYRLLSKFQDNYDTLNHLWGVNHSSTIWKARWSKLWTSDLTQSAKVFVSWVLNNGHYTNVKVAHLGHSDKHYKLCRFQIKSLDHIFCTCNFLSRDGRRKPKPYQT